MVLCHAASPSPLVAAPGPPVVMKRSLTELPFHSGSQTAQNTKLHITFPCSPTSTGSTSCCSRTQLSCHWVSPLFLRRVGHSGYPAGLLLPLCLLSGTSLYFWLIPFVGHLVRLAQEALIRLRLAVCSRSGLQFNTSFTFLPWFITLPGSEDPSLRPLTLSLRLFPATEMQPYVTELTKMAHFILYMGLPSAKDTAQLCLDHVVHLQSPRLPCIRLWVPIYLLLLV